LFNIPAVVDLAVLAFFAGSPEGFPPEGCDAWGMKTFGSGGYAGPMPGIPSLFSGG
jgi:hypothetical protein